MKNRAFLLSAIGLLSSFAAFGGGAAPAGPCDPGAFGLCRVTVTAADCKVVKVDPDPVVVATPQGVPKVMQWKLKEETPTAGHGFEAISLKDANNPDFGPPRMARSRQVVTMHNRHTSTADVHYGIALRRKDGTKCPDPLDPTISNQ